MKWSYKHEKKNKKKLKRTILYSTLISDPEYSIEFLFEYIHIFKISLKRSYKDKQHFEFVEVLVYVLLLDSLKRSTKTELKKKIKQYNVNKSDGQVIIEKGGPGRVR